jgi:hypothetical protein
VKVSTSTISDQIQAWIKQEPRHKLLYHTSSGEPVGRINTQIEFWHVQYLSMALGFPYDMFIQLQSVPAGNRSESTIETQCETRIGSHDANSLDLGMLRG